MINENFKELNTSNNNAALFLFFRLSSCFIASELHLVEWHIDCKACAYIIYTEFRGNEIIGNLESSSTSKVIDQGLPIAFSVQCASLALDHEKKKQTLSCVCACNALNCIPAKRTAQEANKSFIVCDSTQTVAICHLSWWLQQESLEKQKCGNTPTLQIEIKLIVCKLVGVDEVACDGNNAAYELRKMETCISQNITNK